MREGCKRGVYGKDKVEVVKKLDQAMNGMAEGNGVYRLVGVGWGLVGLWIKI